VSEVLFSVGVCVCDLILFDVLQAERWRAVSMAEVWLSAVRQRGLEMDTKALFVVLFLPCVCM